MSATRAEQHEVIKNHRADVEAIVAAMVPLEHHADATEEGTIGLLIALELHDPASGPFWPYARTTVMFEIQRWLSPTSTDIRRELSKRCESWIEQLRDVQAKLRD